jgi:hypothetical protein
MNVRRIAGRMLRQKRKPGRKTVEKVVVFEPWVRDINDYIDRYDIVQNNRGLRLKHGENDDDS